VDSNDIWVIVNSINIGAGMRTLAKKKKLLGGFLEMGVCLECIMFYRELSCLDVWSGSVDFFCGGAW
jgi:hypothetical protein